VVPGPLRCEYHHAPRAPQLWFSMRSRSCQPSAIIGETIEPVRGHRRSEVPVRFEAAVRLQVQKAVVYVAVLLVVLVVMLPNAVDAP
jgi:hypothetical protein